MARVFDLQKPSGIMPTAAPSTSFSLSTDRSIRPQNGGQRPAFQLDFGSSGEAEAGGDGNRCNSMAKVGLASKETSFKSGLALDFGKPSLDFGKLVDGAAKRPETKNRPSSIPSPTPNITPQKLSNQIIGTGELSFKRQLDSTMEAASDRSAKNRKTVAAQAGKDSASTSFSPRSTSLSEGSLLQKSEPVRVDIGAPCGPKPALDPLALKSLQNTPRKTDSVERVERKDSRETFTGGTPASSISKSGDKQMNGPATINKASKHTNLKPADVTSMAAKSGSTIAYSISNGVSNQSRQQDSQRAQQTRKGQSSEELTHDSGTENSDIHDGISYEKMQASCDELVAVVLRSNELLDQAKQVLEESRQATEQLALGATACWAESHFLFPPVENDRVERSFEEIEQAISGSRTCQ